MNQTKNYILELQEQKWQIASEATTEHQRIYWHDIFNIITYMVIVLDDNTKLQRALKRVQIGHTSIN